MAASTRNILTSIFSINKIVHFSRSSHFLSLGISPKWTRTNFASFHSTTTKKNLMEFFDDPKNFGATEVKSGRSWSVDELRQKSNVDLHKLWYVLLKEKNMLLTMEYNCKEECELFPSPERLDKVKDSMACLEEVVRERNESYWQLEVGEEAPKNQDVTELDPEDPLAVVRRAAEAVTQVKDRATLRFELALKEKERKLRKRQLNVQTREVIGLIKRFPHMDMEALQAKYPDVKIEKLIMNKKTKGHHDFNAA